MEDRIKEELALLRTRYPEAEYKEGWVRVPNYLLPESWQPRSIETAIHIRDSYIASGPYGIYVPSGIVHADRHLTNYTCPAPMQPPFPGTWGIFSWESDDWRAGVSASTGHNLLTWVLGFATRFRQVA